MAKALKKKFKVGDVITTFLLKHSGKKVKVSGVIKGIRNEYGKVTYTIENGTAEDFATRTVRLAD